VRRNVADQLRNPHGRSPNGLGSGPVTRRGRIKEPPHFEGIDAFPEFGRCRPVAVSGVSGAEVVAAVKRAFSGIADAGKPFGVNAFDPVAARGYASDGARFMSGCAW
jgi:hypothetical protein